MMATAFLEGILEVARRLDEKNLLAACDGNISVRDGERVLITPSGQPKWKIDSLAEITLDGEVIAGTPSSEMLMHTFIYRTCSEAQAVIHAHPPHAIAWTIAHPDLKELPKEMLSELIIACGAVPISPYARPGTAAMGEVLRPFLPEHKALILARHGALTWGSSLEEACNGMERIEHTAMTLHLAAQLGPLTSLPEEEVEALYAIRNRVGNKLI